MVNKVLFVATVLVSAFATAFAFSGVDMSLELCSSMTQDTWNCLRGQGHEFAIIEAVQGGYGVGSHTATCVAEARKAGFDYVDVYAFICPYCSGESNPATILNELVNYLHSNNVNFGMIWLDIEQCSGCWPDGATSAQYVRDAVAALKSAGIHYGLYSSLYEWSSTVANAVIDPSAPLWYAHYDGVAAFSDPSFWEFGGWKTPSIKQYAGSTSVCGTSVDLNWYPD